MIANIEGGREDLYGMLAELFIRPPDREIVTVLIGADVDIDVLSAAFTALLRGIKESSPPPPYESVYREGVLYGDTTMEVLNTYRSFNVNPSESFDGEPPDHISFELDFMRILCIDEKSAKDDEELQSILVTERDFLERHLMQWVGDLSHEIELKDETGFYRELAVFTKKWIETEYGSIKERLNASEGRR